LALIGSLLNKEEPILELEPEQGDEEEYQVEEPSEEETHINVLWDFHSDENDDEGDNTTEINANEIHTQSKGLLPGAIKPIDRNKKDACLMKTSTPEVSIGKDRSSGDSRNTLVANHPEKDNTSPTTTKVTQDGKIPFKNSKTGVFTLPYPVYNIDYNIVDDLKKFRANITYFDLLKLTQ